MKKYKPKQKYAFKPFIIMLMIITIGAVVLGYFGTRYIIYPIFLNDQSGTEHTQNDMTASSNIDEEVMDTTPLESQASDSAVNLRTNEFDIYHVQLGNFSSKENADQLTTELEKDDIFTYVLEGETYKVVTSPMTSYSQAENIKKQLTSYAPDAFILKRTVDVDNVSAKTTIENLLNDLNEAHTQKEISDTWLTKLKGAFQDGLGDSQMREGTRKTFQNIYEEVDEIDNIEKNELFEVEKMIIMKLEEII